MDYKFYVQMDGQEFGPYSLEEIKELPLLDDTLVTESRLNGEWRPACEFDFEDLSRFQNEHENQRTNSNTEQNSTEVLAETPIVNEPSILNTWNWGAFVLSWLWAVCNGIYWPLLIIVSNFIPYIGPLVGLGICIYLGIRGNDLAWDVYRHKQNAEPQAFIELQARWNKAGAIVLVISILLSVLGALMHYCM